MKLDRGRGLAETRCVDKDPMTRGAACDRAAQLRRDGHNMQAYPCPVVEGAHWHVGHTTATGHHGKDLKKRRRKVTRQKRQRQQRRNR